MPDSLRVLLAESLDYAGLFPPAQLPLAEAFLKYVQYQDHPHAWLVARFVCPAARLDELGECVAVDDSPQILRLSVLGRRAEGDRFDASAALRADCERMKSFHAEHKARASLESYETALPPKISGDGTSLSDFFAQVREALTSHGLAPQGVFVEMPSSLKHAALVEAARAASFNTDPTGRAAAGTTSSAPHALPVRSRLNESSSGNASLDQPVDARFTFGLKIRTGGLEAAAFPQPSELARFIAACREAGCRWKATAGLHHPLSAQDHALGVWHCGFLNLFAATALSHSHRLSTAQIEAILQEPLIDAFRFDAESLSWRGYAATIPQIASARREALVSFGSCSFDEPVDGLARLHLLED